jgi:hypothetical protein
MSFFLLMALLLTGTAFAEDTPTLSAPETEAQAPVDAASPKEPLKARAVVVDIDSNRLDYDEVKDVYVATGNVKVVISEQNTELTADRVVYDQNRSLMVAEGRVIITKRGQVTEGTFAKIDLSRQSALITEPNTELAEVRIQARMSMSHPLYHQLENGQLILKPKKAGSPDPLANHENLATLAYTNPAAVETLDKGPQQGSFSMKVKELDLVRNDDGTTDILMKRPTMYFKNRPLLPMLESKLRADEFSGRVDYLGPDIGFDPNFGGFYAGPGWDFKLGRGSVRLSPVLSYGPSAVGSDGQRINEGTQAGVGFLGHYRSDNLLMDYGYNSHAGQFIGYGEMRVLTDSTKLVFSQNQDYANGVVGIERPRFMMQLTDTRKLAEFKNLELDVHQSLGFARDNFFPNNRTNFFVRSNSPEPTTAGRYQLQAQIINQKPLISLGNFMNVGFRGQALFSAYSTGDALTVLRAGPNVNFNLFNRFYSTIDYFAAQTFGETPFVFDAYFRGSQNMVLNNAIRVSNFLTVGARQDLNLLRENAQDALAVGNAVYALIGPKDIKLNLAFDIIRRRSFVGINFVPGGKSTPIDFERMRVFQPENFTNPMLP